MLDVPEIVRHCGSVFRVSNTNGIARRVLATAMEFSGRFTDLVGGENRKECLPSGAIYFSHRYTAPIHLRSKGVIRAVRRMDSNVDDANRWSMQEGSL